MKRKRENLALDSNGKSLGAKTEKATREPSAGEEIHELISSIKKIEEYLIENNSKAIMNEDAAFNFARSSFYIWLKRTYKIRMLRIKFFNSEYFSGEAAWNILLDLAIAQLEGNRISVSSACIASGVPSTTALRWIGILENDEMVVREVDISDRRRAFLRISDKAMRSIYNYYKSINKSQT